MNHWRIYLMRFCWTTKSLLVGGAGAGAIVVSLWMVHQVLPDVSRSTGDVVGLVLLSVASLGVGLIILLTAYFTGLSQFGDGCVRQIDKCVGGGDELRAALEAERSVPEEKSDG